MDQQPQFYQASRKAQQPDQILSDLIAALEHLMERRPRATAVRLLHIQATQMRVRAIQQRAWRGASR